MHVLNYVPLAWIYGILPQSVVSAVKSHAFILHTQFSLEYLRKANSVETLRGNRVKVALNNNEAK